MNKILIFISALIISSGVYAQEKKFWVDIEAEQSFGLNKWFDNPDLNRALRKNSSTDFKARFNMLLSKNVGVYSDIAVSLYSYNSDYKSANYFNEFDLNHYYLSSDYFGENHQNPGARLTIGAFYKFRFNRLGLIPHLGIGFEDMYVPMAGYTVKRHDTNEMYKVSYQWHPDDENFISDKNGILALQIISSYPISNAMSLILGINYRYRLTRVNFKARTTDYYDQTLINQIDIKGENMHSLGVSLGVSFGWGR